MDRRNFMTETPSKTYKEENFPVASFLIPKKLRTTILTFYTYARNADDIADSSELSSQEKIELLNEFEKVILGENPTTQQSICALQLRETLKEKNISIQSALDLLKAFKQDAIGYTYKNWNDLMAYCYNSAGSVGRFMLDLHQENPSTYWPSNALCAALQLNNHLQDCKDDFLTKKRVYLPLDWFKENNTNYDALLDIKTSGPLRNIFNQMCNGIDALLIESSPLPLVIVNRGLRMEVCTIYKLAQLLLNHLKTKDILEKHVDLNKFDWFLSFFYGIFLGTRRKKIKCLDKK